MDEVRLFLTKIKGQRWDSEGEGKREGLKMLLWKNEKSGDLSPSLKVREKEKSWSAEKPREELITRIM